MSGKHDADYFRKRRAAQRKAREAEGIVAANHGAHYPDGFPPAVFERGRRLAEMMRTPLCMWPAEWSE